MWPFSSKKDGGSGSGGAEGAAQAAPAPEAPPAPRKPIELREAAVESLRGRMKNRARMKCDEVTAKFVDCSKVHFLSVAWQCRAELHAMNECMKQYTTDDTLEEFKRRWVAAGMPSDPKHDLWPEEKPEWVAYVRRREERDPPKKDGMSALKKQFYNA